MILRGKFTRRRKALLALVLMMLAYLGYAWFADIAITKGVEQKDMDWNGDGTVTQGEIAQAVFTVVVEQKQDGNRQCNAFAWRNGSGTIRMDCKTVFQPDAE